MLPGTHGACQKFQNNAALISHVFAPLWSYQATDGAEGQRQVPSNDSSFATLVMSKTDHSPKR